jgi:branched-chain amino acid transport system substrate-binding protein
MVRHFGPALAVGLSLALGAAGAAAASFSDDVVRIGVLTDLSGPASDMGGNGSVIAAEMAAEDFGGTVGGAKIEVVSADNQLKADLSSQIARRWYDSEQVDIILDVPSSAAALAVQQIAKERGKLFITHGSGTSDFSGKFCTPTTMQWVFDTYALSKGTASTVTRRGGKTWFFLTADYAFGHSLEKDASAFVEANGGRVLGSVRHPFLAPDLTSFVLQAQASGAKIIGLASGPPDNMNAIKIGGEFGLFQAGQQMAGLLVFLTDIHGLGLKAGQGLLLTTGFYWDRDAETRAWSERFFERRKAMPTMVQAGIYSSVMHYLKAVKAAGTDDGREVAAKMRAMPVEDFFAGKATLRADGRLVYDMYLAQVKTPAESKGEWDLYKILEAIPAQETVRPAAESECPLLKK